MYNKKIIACLLVACVIFLIEDQQLLGQSTQPLQPGTALTSAPSSNNNNNNDSGQQPSIYGNPFNTQMSGGASGAATGSGSGNGNGSGGGKSVAVPDGACSVSPMDMGSLAFEPDPLGSAPGGGPDSLSAPVMDLRPLNPVIKTCEGGRIIVRVENKRFYAYHLGDEIPISITILVDDGVQINLTSLSQQVLGFEGSDFMLIPVRVVSIASRPYPQRPHSTLYGIQLAVQTFVTKPTLAFTLDLKYAVDVPPGVTQPNWRLLTTPDFIITNTPVITSKNDDELEEGDLTPAAFRSSWVQWPMMVAGLFIVVWFGFLQGLIVRFNRARPGRVVPPEETAWAVFNKVFVDARVYGSFSREYVRNVDGALRVYLAQSLKIKTEALTAKQIDALLTSDTDLLTLAHDDSETLPGGSNAEWQRLIVSALNKCESVIYARADRPKTLTEGEADELMSELKQLVPEPEN